MQQFLEAELAASDSYTPRSEMLDGKWSDYVWPAGQQADHSPSTGVAKAQLLEMGKASVTLPDAFVSCLATLSDPDSAV